MLDPLNTQRICDALDALDLRYRADVDEDHVTVPFNRAGDTVLLLRLAVVSTGILSIVVVPAATTTHIPPDCIAWFANAWNAQNRWPTAAVRPDTDTLIADSSFVFAAGVSNRQLLETIDHVIVAGLKYLHALEDFASPATWSAEDALGDLLADEG